MPDETILFYTRRHLAQNHLLIPQPNTHCRLPPLAPIVDIRDPFTFFPCNDLDVPLDPNQSEKLVLEHDTAIYLSSILRVPDGGDELLCGDFRWSLTRRIEEPLVKGKRKTRAYGIREDTLKDVLPGMGGDTGILWDRNVRRQVQDYVRNEEAEKMDISPEVLQFLQDVHRPKSLPSAMEVMVEEVKYRRPVSELMTPPLLPLSPITPPPGLRLSETLDLMPINAGPTSLLIADLAAYFIAADSMVADLSTGCTSSFLQLIPPTSSPIRKRPRPETLMVEAPLTPPASINKRVRFVSLQLPSYIRTPELEGAEDESEGKLILARVEQELEQEQLQEADSTLRVDVPVMDFSRPKLPWEERRNGPVRMRDLEAWAGLASRKWGGSGCVGMELSWRPFLKSATRVSIEELGDGEFVDELVASSQDGEKVERSFLGGLGSLGLKGEKKEDDAGLEPGVFEERIDIKGLVKKKQKRPKHDDHTRAAADESCGNKFSGPQRDAGPLSTNPLDTFMALRSRVAKKSANTPNSRTIQINPIAQLSLPPTALAAPSLSPALPPFPVPKTALPASPGTFIASTALLSERRLFRDIKDLYPTATIIERDFTVPILDTFNSDPQALDAANSEADLLLSPLSGVVLTTLQKIRQAPLPGNALSSTRQRVADVALLYERLFVLVIGTIHSSDTGAIAGFMSFSAALQVKVYVRLIPEESDVAARWVVALMVREGSPVRLLDEETLWERFLRRAGFNAFAAQVVLRECREIGLRGILEMEGEKRRLFFVQVAGERVGERVERRLVGVWEE